MKHIRAASTKGQGLVEYALILGLVAVVSVGVLSVTGTALGSAFNQVVLNLEPESMITSPVETEISEIPPLAIVPNPEEVLPVTDPVIAPEEVAAVRPTFSELSSTVTSCVTHNGSKNSLTNAANHNDLSTFNTLLDAHSKHIDATCMSSLRDMASRMA